MIAGVCGGLGQYFNVNPTFLRLAPLIPALRKPSA
jgi:phage shock protein PspC (stress-responsive transcriptional regulator)